MGLMLVCRLLALAARPSAAAAARLWTVGMLVAALAGLGGVGLLGANVGAAQGQEVSPAEEARNGPRETSPRETNGRGAAAPRDLPVPTPDILSEGGLRPDALYMLDDDGNRVLLPGMRFEEIDRLRNLDAGYIQPARAYSFDSIAITGTATRERAALEVRTALRVDPTAEGWTAIPLLMGNFHRLGPADVVGVERYRMDLDPQHGGYRLWVQTDRPRDIEVRMRVAARVSSEPAMGLDFQLPETPATVTLEILGQDLEASVIGRGDEVVRRQQSTSEETTFVVESGGGSFTLQWRPRDVPRSGDQVLEAQSDWVVRWSAPQARPTASVDLEVRNRRGNVGPFEIALPPDAEILESPVPNLAVAITPVTDSPGEAGGDGSRTRLRVVPDESLESSRVEVRLELEYDITDSGPDLPMQLLGIEVPGAVRQTGKIELEIGSDYRLRWLPRPVVRPLWRAGSGDTAERRSYEFEFDRVPFELPMWLTARQQRLRVTPTYQIRLLDAVAELEVLIEASGTSLDGRPLAVDLAGWELQAVEEATDGRPSEAYRVTERGIEVELAGLTPAGSDAARLRILAAQQIDAADDRVDLRLPQLRPSSGEPAIVSPGVLRLRPAEGLALVTDLEASRGLSEGPIERSALPEARRDELTFRVQPASDEPRYVGYVMINRPRVTIEPRLAVTVQGDQLQVESLWLVAPQGNLRGRLPVRLPPEDDPDHWEVLVDGRPAVIRGGEDGVVELLFEPSSPEGPHQVQLRSEQPLPRMSPDGWVERRVGIPLPGMPDATVRTPIPLRLEGSPMVALEGAAQRESSGMLDALPSEGIAVRIGPQPSRGAERQVISRAWLHSEVGRSMRRDRLVARITGGGTPLRLGWPATEEDVTVRVTLDGEPVTNLTVDPSGMSIPLPPSDQSHTVDIRLWRAAPESATAMAIDAALQLPPGMGQVYWELVLPVDQHLIWASPGAGRAMQWQYDRWYVHRVPTRRSIDLARWVGTEADSEVAVGNRYLLVAADSAALQTVVASRSLIWAVVGSLVLGCAAALIYLPGSRHPLSVLAAAVLLAGLALLAPDAAVIVGQLTLAALILVAVMLGVRSTLATRPRVSVFGGAAATPRDESSHTAVHTTSSLRRLGDPSSTRAVELVPPSRVAEGEV